MSIDPEYGKDSIDIAGAGPAGFAAAITLARAGRRVVVHEAHGEVGHRFQRDLQGLENWSSEEDVLADLERLGVTTDFARMPCLSGMAFDASGRGYRIRSCEALCYLVERGPGPLSLDSALLAQARALGVEVRFNHRLARIEHAGILAVGPKAADAIAVGYHFDTAMEDGFWVICDDALAPKGYAYLLVMRGQERAGDARRYLRRLYRPTWAKSLLLPWARRRYQSKRHDASCDHVNCTCVWCRCGGEYA